MDYERPRGEPAPNPQDPASILQRNPTTTSNSGKGTSSDRSITNPISSQEKLIETDHPSVAQEPQLQEEDASRGLDPNQPLPPLPTAHNPDTQGWRKTRTFDSHPSMRVRSDLDYIVPFDEKSPRPSTVEHRLRRTLEEVDKQITTFTSKARLTGYLQNTAIGLQIVLGSLTTGLSALATTGKQTALQTTILGGLTTIVASYLAKTRGSNEPESSLSRIKDLENFKRRCEAFILDHGNHTGRDFDDDISKYRKEFEELLGNISGEVKRSSSTV